MQNKFSFGPSQEDEGRKKTVHPTPRLLAWARTAFGEIQASSKAIADDSYLLINRMNRILLFFLLSCL
jgi:hypothetical protein